jgi:OOP family OmpA-OmpF porin
MPSIKNRMLLYLLAALLLTGTSMQQAQAQPRETVKRILKTDNFMVLIDSSSSMDESYMGSQKLGLAKDFVSRMNQTLPDIKINSAMRKFGAEKCIFDSTSSLLGLAPYAKKTYEDALQTVKEAGGFSPMAVGINASTDDLKAAQGKMAMIIVSDWDETGFINNPVAAAEAMKRQYGDRICIYPVMVGKDLDGMKLMEKIATVGQCGFATQAEKIASQQDMSQFIDKVFFTNTVIPDSDNDGVNDSLDKCPGTPAGVSVNSDGCPLDSDKDGVYDYLDKCPGTPTDVRVDKDGCPIQKIIKLNVEFDTAKFDVKDKYREEIKVAADYMQKNPQTNVVIEGHTDNVGSEESNAKLSESRANSVKEYLITKLGVSKDRLKSVGYGSKKPVASNDTVEGKQKNRRVQAVITAIVKK